LNIRAAHWANHVRPQHWATNPPSKKERKPHNGYTKGHRVLEKILQENAIRVKILSKSVSRTYGVFFWASGVHDKIHRVFITYRQHDTWCTEI